MIKVVQINTLVSKCLNRVLALIMKFPIRDIAKPETFDICHLVYSHSQR